MARIFIIIAVIYLSFGFALTLNSYIFEWRTFECGNSGVVWTQGGFSRNPDPDRCSRRVLKPSYIASIPAQVLILPYVYGMRFAYHVADQGIRAFTQYDAPYVADRLTQSFQPTREVHVIGIPSATSTPGYIPWLGTYQEAPSHNGLKKYQSDRFGVSFSYPEKYLLFETKGEGFEGREYYVVSLRPDSPFIRDLMKGVHYDTETPPAIHLSFYREPSRSLSLEVWVRANSLSNFDLSDPAQSGALEPTTVAGVPAFAYHYEGLYSVDAIAFAYDDWVVIAAVDATTSGTDPQKDDFRAILASVQLEN
jgi:hypothetical protein